MDGDRRDIEGTREFRLEGVTLFVVGGALTLALVGAFFVGRWYERSVQPPRFSAGGGADPLANVVEAEEPADVDESATFFDTLEGEEKEAEPRREIGREDSARPPGGPKPKASTADRGPFYVQVFAGRDRRAAESLVGQLQAADYSVRLFTDRSGGDALFKVRVGGYADESEARSTAEDLVQKGYGGAWVTRVE
jgi:cell division septation protein DedD